MQADIAELQKNVASQDATSTEETFMSPKMAYLAEELQTEKMTLLNQLAALKEQLQMSQMDCDHARELASKADIGLQLLKTKNEESLKQLEEVNMILKSEQEEVSVSLPFVTTRTIYLSLKTCGVLSLHSNYLSIFFQF